MGTAIRRYSTEFRRPRGVYLSVDAPDDIERSLRASGLCADDVDLIVATDGEGILGIGDWGVGGIDIAVGKLAVYTAAAGIDPRRTLPVMLDVGTNRQELLDNHLYLGNRHPRVDRDTYDAFIDAYVTTATRLFPDALLHWEDFGTANARRILDRYRDRVCTFNDDIQGTGAVNLAAVLSGVRATGTPLPEHRIVVFGAGTAGIGVADQLRDALIAEGLTAEQATARFWCVDRYGLLTTDQGDRLRDVQRPYARPAEEVEGWHRDENLPGIPLNEVVRRARPTILIGTSGQGGAFTEDIVRTMAEHTERPIILPMSNPTDLAEATPPTCSTGPTAVRSWPPEAPSRRSSGTVRPTRSARPTTRWSSPASASARSSPAPPASATACCARRPTRWPGGPGTRRSPTPTRRSCRRSATCAPPRRRSPWPWPARRWTKVSPGPARTTSRRRCGRPGGSRCIRPWKRCDRPSLSPPPTDLRARAQLTPDPRPAGTRLVPD